MGMVKQEVHRPGAFKQVNKAHKTGRHRSKGSISSEAKGKVGVKALSKRALKNLSKDARRNQSSQIRKRKREEVLQQKRNLGGSHFAPILVCIIPLQEDVDVENVLSILTKAVETANITNSPCGTTHFSIPRFKQRFSIIIPPVGNLFATLDVAKVATTILFVASAVNETDNNPREEVLDDWGKEIILPCVAQGLTTPVVALVNVESLHIKKRQDFKNHVQSEISKWLPEEKVFQLDTSTDALNVLRRVGSQKQKTISYRSKRAHLLAEELRFHCNEGSTELGTLMISGYLRNVPLSVNGLIHISGFGDFQMSQIDAPEDPYPMERKIRKHCNAMDDEQSIRILERADPKKQESLESENIPDPMDAEQTWPTEEELAQAAAAQKKKIVKRVPKGTSEYQAAWIPDEDGEELSDDESEDQMSVDEAKSQADSEVEAEEDEEEYETITVSEAPDERYDKNIDITEEKEAIDKLKQAKLDAQFPDEVDTPQGTLAKQRFQKYRGLESFRTSPWDPKENLPIDYARIFQFENFDRTRKRIFKESKEIEGAMPGWYITIHVMNVRRDLFTAFSTLESRPLIIFGLLPNEHKMSLLNLVLKHTNTSSRPVKSKDRLIFQCGFRRFSACPIFSQHTNGNKHKYERYFQPESTVVASMYAPITFSPCPVLCYVEKLNKSLELIATGSVLSANPDRIVVKRVILSGHPFKVHKRSAVIRFMFFHREDINWFKPIQLRTKYGRRGHIKEPLGTHGHMKCVFNGQLKSQDTVLMNLYKRVFPKWTYEPLLLTELEHQDQSMNVE
ncbi:Pre-rRNA-processing protein TSR1 like protein [Habropoda laboriosa]|uniref:Pre-rRNA-processing protein TSR1 homolog n=1 Tax=Habropoda laboriosa TaxID=597456 RepID=A0A0L7RA28_9HYME|nr:PREDICTED: pre-rRNA-processing protein TSR1 homolog [Habropoda laboriosa]KOC67732.1 Pre-rRNA-processing protein TSR1 like protein [Habropoda laboriosa]